MFFFFFFFSSRRRHTRSLRDWSSDVCSSDLVLEHAVAEAVAGHVRAAASARQRRRRPYLAGLLVARSEEHTSELQSRRDLVCRLLLGKKKKLLAELPTCVCQQGRQGSEHTCR